jgi:single-strand DNA-binding protein
VVSLNKVMLIGNVGKDPEMRFTPNGNPVTSFTLATNRMVQVPEGEPKKETEWHNIVTWGKLAEQCNQFLAKGRRVFVEGRIQTRSWENQEGQKRSKVEIVANRVMFLDRSPGTATLPAEGEDIPEGDQISPEDVPF